MIISSLELVNFRKFKRFKLENLKMINVIIGKNGVGKTSIIEGIYFGSIAKSFKSYYDNLLINEESDFMKVKINLENKRLELIVTQKEKKAKQNGKIINKLSDYVCQYSVIIFSPDDMRLLKDSPNIRRNYLNIELSNINREYIRILNNYNKIIKNKNDYLKKINYNPKLDIKYLDILDEKIIELGLKINEIRRKYIEEINEYIDKIFSKFDKSSNLKIEYISDFNDKNIVQIKNLMLKSREREIALGLTNIGIHRDDYIFKYKNQNAAYYASQGIQKLILLSLKLSEIKVLNNKYKIKPILLLDDLFSELDAKNQKKILNLISKKYQTFITTTDLNNIKIKELNDINIIKLKENQNGKK